MKRFVRPSILDGSRFYRLFDEAERVRWRIADISWADIDKEQVSEPLVDTVCAIAASELTTWSATRMFLDRFEADVDFSQWIAVWLYEETKHPYVLMQWLRCVGQVFDETYITRARSAHPFVRSSMGTLTLNILSEIEASAVYASLAAQSPEPVLASIARLLSSDEARHAGSFYAYASRHIETSSRPTRERIEALKALYFWLTSIKDVQHPVAIVSRQTASMSARGDSGALRRTVEARMLSMIGTLIGEPLPGPDAVLATIRRLSANSSQVAMD